MALISLPLCIIMEELVYGKDILVTAHEGQEGM